MVKVEFEFLQNMHFLSPRETCYVEIKHKILFKRQLALARHAILHLGNVHKKVQKLGNSLCPKFSHIHQSIPTVSVEEILNINLGECFQYSLAMIYIRNLVH